jgi:hypothetical protein
MEHSYGTWSGIQLHSPAIHSWNYSREITRPFLRTGKKSGIPFSSRIRLISSQRAPAWQTKSPSSSEGVVGTTEYGLPHRLTVDRENLVHARQVNTYTSCWMLFTRSRTYSTVSWIMKRLTPANCPSRLFPAPKGMIGTLYFRETLTILTTSLVDVAATYTA